MGKWTGVALALVLVLCGTLNFAPAAVLGQGVQRASGDPAVAATVTLTIDFGDGFAKVYSALHWFPAMTAWQVLEAAEHAPHPLAVAKTGSIPRDYFVTGIDGVQNQGGGARRRNWLYWVDGKLASAGVGSQQVAAGQKILFKFAASSPDGKP